jgi:hypothetical protein
MVEHICSGVVPGATSFAQVYGDEKKPLSIQPSMKGSS